MYSRQCGIKTNDNADHCSAYGTNQSGIVPVDAQMTTRSYGNKELRRIEIQELQKMIRYFGRKAPQYCEYDAICSRLEQTKRTAPVALLIWGIVIMIPSLIVFLYFQSGQDAYVAFLAGAFGLLPALSMIVSYALMKYSRQQHHETLLRRRRQLVGELYRHYFAYGSCPLSIDHTHPNDLNALLTAIRSGKADNTRAAVDLLEEDTHRSNAEICVMVHPAVAVQSGLIDMILGAANAYSR